MPITIFSKPNCGECLATKSLLDLKGIDYVVRDVMEDAEAMNTVLGLGYRKMPVVLVHDTNHWAGFNPTRIEEIAATV